MMFLFDLVRGPSFRVQKNETEFEVEVETATGITTETEMASDMENEMEIEGRTGIGMVREADIWIGTQREKRDTDRGKVVMPTQCV